MKIIPPKEELEYYYFDLNYNYAQIAKHYQVSQATVCGWCKKLNIQKEASLIWKKARETREEHFGEDPWKNPEVVAKRKQTCLEKYGVENPASSVSVQEKMRNTSIERYGVPFAMQNEKIKNGVVDRNVEKYGVRSTSQIPEVKEKQKKTLMERFGVDVPAKSSIVLQKMKDTWEERYGDDESEEAKAIVSKRKRSCFERYGFENSMECPELLEKYKKTFSENHPGVTNPNSLHLSEETLKIISTKETLEDYIASSPNKKVRYLANALKYSYTCLLNKIHEYGLYSLVDNGSVAEDEITEILKGWGVVCEKTRALISPYEIDIYCPDYKIGIEYNGNYWHSVNCGKDKIYHQMKSLRAQEKGIFLYHIYEYEWENPDKKQKIINQLQNLFGKNNNIIYARKTEIREVSDIALKRSFLRDNHLQEEDKSSLAYGLFYNNRLVSLMTFCKPRFSRQFDWELSRYCSLSNTTVVGGASKLFHEFLRNNSGSIVTYSDFGKTRGLLYEKLGFVFSHISRPNYVWLGREDIKTRYQVQMEKERETMEAKGYLQIFDAGNKVWIFKGEKS